MSVFAHYRLFHPRALQRPKASGKEWRLAAARLGEGHTADDLKTAIDGYHRSPFHLGDNDRGETYLSLELILRDSSHVLKGIEYATKPALPAMTDKERRGIAAGQAFIARGFANGGSENA